MKTTKLSPAKCHKRIVAVAVFASLIAIKSFAQPVRESNAVSRDSASSHKFHNEAKPISEFKYQPAKGCVPLSFETLGGFQIKVDWIMNPTNSAADTLKREGEIPARLKALDGKKISIAGFMKPIRLDAGDTTEFLLVPSYVTCCDGQKLGVNQWVHVLSPNKSIPLAGENPLAIRGVLRVGEKLAGSNVVSIYRLEDVELEPTSSAD
jgi:hypothetical protein